MVEHYLLCTRWVDGLPRDQNSYGHIDIETLRRHRTLAKKLSS